MSALGQKRTFAVQHAHVRFVPIADIRLTYSITLSAAFSRPGVTVRPSALPLYADIH